MRMLSSVVRPRICWGQQSLYCPWSGTRRHARGFVDVFGTVHFSDRRFTRPAARNLLMLVARREREMEGSGWLNHLDYAWLYPYVDSVRAQALAMSFGIRLPARLFDRQRAKVRTLAAAHGIRLSKRPTVRAWLRGSK